ncbi:uncharacterized protein [Spinacia oleracea]|uniref:Uncharacterized protein n=1 Tax=Spinacia oleracea TaxID=3562 RepID=A0ABM3R255_SPIOL|nr:uncharacterized protein LOC130464255 [Spinacia oleracea]
MVLMRCSNSTRFCKIDMEFRYGILQNPTFSFSKSLAEIRYKSTKRENGMNNLIGFLIDLLRISHTKRLSRATMRISSTTRDLKGIIKNQCTGKLFIAGRRYYRTTTSKNSNKPTTTRKQQQQQPQQWQQQLMQ